MDQGAALDVHLDLLAAALRGESPVWPRDSLSASRVQALARLHGVAPLLARRVAAGELADWPESLEKDWRRILADETAREMAWQRELPTVLDALARSGVEPLLLKGSALRHSHYVHPALRPCADVDLLLAPGTEAAAARSLEALGYRPDPTPQGWPPLEALGWRRAGAAGLSYDLDVHRRVNNLLVLSQALDHGELTASAVPIPSAGTHARGPCAVHALLLACLHWAGHAGIQYHDDGECFIGGDRLIWLLDLHLLLARMGEEEIGAFVRMARLKRVRAICRRALLRSQALLGTPLPTRLEEALRPEGRAEPSEHLLDGGRWGRIRGELAARGTWSERAAWLWGLAFPPPEHMRRRYSGDRVRCLPVLYARRTFAWVTRTSQAR